ncbi:uncharacterized protein BKA55DRAFT_600512 [Fusarium redolens]|uniref:NAD(P)-binding protein n=1 Tax=Fusarium redolens TaxID=48865 RepID=A0A9P9FXM2_FUSRE|nr:uncharacterized protein BKA55DRAFT_600512 [Fusarium redolens]KAH7202874.1 hypothetical protein BKA55DRAFT_600512 [Fusarium redolens]
MVRVWFVTVLESGDIVVATARNPSRLGDLVTKYGPDKIFAISLDVTDFDQANKAVKEAVDKFGRIDVAVDNAGHANLASIEDIDMEGFRAQVDVNLFGVVNVTKAVVPIMLSLIGGRIEVAPFGIKVTVAEPTGINTNMGATATDNSKVSEPYEQTVGQIIQLISKEYSGWTEVSEIARAIIHLSNVEDPLLRIMVAKTLADSDEKWAKVSKLEF